MKTLKKYFKVILCFLAFAVCSFLLTVSPTISAVSAAMDYTVEHYNVAINAIKMPTSKLDLSKNPTQPFAIPLINSQMGTASDGYAKSVTIRVIDPAGKSHDYKVGGTENDTDYFGTTTIDSKEHITVKPLVSGVYKIVYIVTAEDADTTDANDYETKTFYSNTYEVEVINVAYELDFTQDNGLAHLFKPEVATGSEKIKLPQPKVKIIGGSVIESAVASIRVTRNGKVQPLNETFTDGTKSAFISEGTGADIKYYINPALDGNYSVEYTYKEGVNRPTKTFKFKVTDNFVASSKLNVNEVTLPSMQLGQEGIKLPKLTVNNETTKGIAHNVTKIEIVKENNTNIKCVLENNTYEFDFVLGSGNGKFSGTTNYDDMVGVYKVTYYVTDAYGNETTYSKLTTNSITISSTPSVYLSYDYDVELATGVKYADSGVNSFEVEDEVDTDASTSLKQEYGYAEILLPAIYGTDTITETKDLMFIRILRNASSRTAYYIDNVKYENGKLTQVMYGEQGYNYALNAAGNTDSIIGSPNLASKFKFSANGNDQDYAGTYYVEYLVYSKNVKTRYGTLYTPGTSTKYSITILNTEISTKESDLKVDIENLTTSSVRPEDSITARVVSSDANNADARLKNAVFFYTKKNSANDLKTDIKAAADEALSDTKHNALDSDLFMNYLNDKTVTAKYENFTPVEESSTKNTFVLENLKSKFTTEQLADIDAITLVAVTINDHGKIAIKSVELKVKQIDEIDPPVGKILTTETDGKYDNDLTFEDSNNSDTPTIYDLKDFDQTVKVNLPTVAYTDDDTNLQLSVMYYVINKDGEGNIIKSPETKYGLDFKTPSNVQYKVKKVGSAISQQIDGGYITTSEVGTYYVVYTATDAAGNTSVTYFTFNVVDSSKPILSVNVTNPYDAEGITQSGNTITAEIGSVLDFETTLRSGDGNNTDYTSLENIDVTIDNGEGLSYKSSGRDGYSYIFNSVGTYTVTISGEYTVEVNSQDVTRTADSKIIKVVITEQKLDWTQEFDIQQYASKDEWVYLPYMTTNHEADVEVKVTTPTGATPTEGEAEYDVVDGIQVWKFKTNKTSKGFYKVVYKATSKYSSIEKSFKIKVGDDREPTLTMNYTEELKQDIVFDSEIEYKIDVDSNKKKVVITASKNGAEVYSYDLGLRITDEDEEGNTTDNTYTLWNNLTAELTGSNVTSKGNGVYAINGVGKCTLTLKASDGELENVRTELFEFNVVTESDADEKENTVVGTVLIIISLVVLAGVILFFALTGRKGKGKKVKGAKKSNKSEKVEEVETETAEESEEEIAEEVKETEDEKSKEDSNDDEAKSGEVE